MNKPQGHHAKTNHELADSHQPNDCRDLRAWAYLSRVVEGPHPMLMPLIEKHGVEDVVERIKSRRAVPEPLLSATESRFHHDHSQEDLDEAAQQGYRLIWPGCNEWPEDKMRAFSALEPQSSADAPPVALWVRGRNPRQTLGEAVALVGTRAASKYGLATTRHFAQELSARGISVVSGGALGVDAEAHRAVVERGGVTIAVAACGAGVAYPRVHAPLFDEIAQQGSLITEYPPGVHPARHRFLTRNRLVAALSDATIVVEAGWRSGARNTATWAGRLHRPIGAVPGPITSAASSGCHDLIRQQQAVLVASAENIMALYRTVGSVDEDSQLELEWAATAVQKLSRNELQVYDALHPHTVMQAVEVAGHAGFTLALTTHLLLTLHKAGLVERVGGGWRRHEQE